MSAGPNRAFQLARRARVLTQAQVAALAAIWSSRPPDGGAESTPTTSPRSRALFDAAIRGGDARLATLAGQALNEAAPLRSTRIAEDIRMLTGTAAPLEHDPAFRPRVRELRRTAKRVTQAVA